MKIHINLKHDGVAVEVADHGDAKDYKCLSVTSTFVRLVIGFA